MPRKTVEAQTRQYAALQTIGRRRRSDAGTATGTQGTRGIELVRACGHSTCIDDKGTARTDELDAATAAPERAILAAGGTGRGFRLEIEQTSGIRCWVFCTSQFPRVVNFQMLERLKSLLNTKIARENREETSIFQANWRA